MAKSAKNSVSNSQSVANKKSASRTRKPKQAPQVQEVVSTAPTITPKLIIAQRRFDRWYIYFKGVRPEKMWAVAVRQQNRLSVTCSSLNIAMVQ